MENAEAGPSRSVPPAVDFSAGVIAGVAGLVVGQPLDIIKVRYQTPQFAGRYASTFGALSLILREEKVPGLFKGVLSPMAGIAFINGVVFTSYSFFMNLQHPSEFTTQPTLRQIFLAGAGSGVLGAFVACPTELVKIRQQSAPTHLNPSVFDVCRDVIRTSGIRGLYRGFSATAIRDLAYGPYFLTYEATCRFFKSRKPPLEPPPHLRHHPQSLIDEAEDEIQSLSWPELMTAGGLAGVVGWAATFPIDVIKTRMQALSPSGSTANASMIKVAQAAIRKEGWRIMFAGLSPTLIRAVPVNMVIFLTFEGLVAAYR